MFRTPTLPLTLHGGGPGRWGVTATTSVGWHEQVDRSAITLKLMTYAPTGALVAAPTAGLPELVGAERNWDYRPPGSGTAPFRCMRCWALGSPRGRPGLQVGHPGWVKLAQLAG